MMKRMMILPKSEQIYTFQKRRQRKSSCLKVEMRNNNLKLYFLEPLVFLERLFEGEVPEIFDGLITIKKIVRVPGERAKVAESYDERIDPVGMLKKGANSWNC